jgi:hypothetical protein
MQYTPLDILIKVINALVSPKGSGITNNASHFRYLIPGLTRKPCRERNVNKVRNVFSKVDVLWMPYFRFTDSVFWKLNNIFKLDVASYKHWLLFKRGRTAPSIYHQLCQLSGHYIYLFSIITSWHKNIPTVNVRSIINNLCVTYSSFLRFIPML